MGWRDPIRAVTPAFALAWYRRARLGLRGWTRALAPIRTCRVRGLAVRLVVGSEVEQYRAETYADKEPETLDWLDEHLRDGDVFLDVGANIGLYVLYAAKRRPGCLVYAMEPESQNFARLCRNIALNGLSNVIPCNFALSDREGLALLHVSSLEPGSALHGLDSRSPYRTVEADSPLRQGTVTLTLDRLVTHYGLPQPSLIKIDVDGAEAQVLEGARDTLTSVALRTVLVEVLLTERAGDTWADRKLGSYGLEEVGQGRIEEFNGCLSRNVIYRRAAIRAGVL